jgi:hypothetical protein
MYSIISTRPEIDAGYHDQGTLVQLARDAARLHARLGMLSIILRPDGTEVGLKAKTVHLP